MFADWVVQCVILGNNILTFQSKNIKRTLPLQSLKNGMNCYMTMLNENTTEILLRARCQQGFLVFWIVHDLIDETQSLRINNSTQIVDAWLYCCLFYAVSIDDYCHPTKRQTDDYHKEMHQKLGSKNEHVVKTVHLSLSKFSMFVDDLLVVLIMHIKIIIVLIRVLIHS